MFATASPPSSEGSGSKPWQINLLYDSDCPLCMKEVDFLRKRDVEGASSVLCVLVWLMFLFSGVG